MLYWYILESYRSKSPTLANLFWQRVTRSPATSIRSFTDCCLDRIDSTSTNGFKSHFLSSRPPNGVDVVFSRSYRAVSISSCLIAAESNCRVVWDCAIGSNKLNSATGKVWEAIRLRFRNSAARPRDSHAWWFTAYSCWSLWRMPGKPSGKKEFNN